MSARVVIRAGREKSLLRRHPWLFSGAVHKVQGNPGLGDTVILVSQSGEFLATAGYSPHSQIRARVWSFNESDNIDDDFFYQQIARANQQRQYQVAKVTNAYRVVAGESDGLPGITIDKYDNWLVCQLLSAGAERHRGAICQALRRIFPDCGIYERSDVDVRKKEGLEVTKGILHDNGSPRRLVIQEHDLKLWVDIEQGHKTGYYLDQRDARQAVTHYAKAQRVLNCFSYTGGFGLYAAAAGASSVTNIDMSEPALVIAKENHQLNQLDTPTEYLQADVFAKLREFQKSGERFDVIVLDPPKFVDSKASLTRACRGYKDINRLAAELLSPGGVLLTFSCSGLLSTELFQKVVADGALDAGRDMQIIERLYQAPDHPVALPYPEGLYLKGLVLRATN